MPGMLDTVLNLGLNDSSVEGLARSTDNERFAWDSYRRFVQMFGNVSRGIAGERFEAAITQTKAERAVRQDTELDAVALKELTKTFKAIYRDHAGADFPQDPREQLHLAIRAVFDSWVGDRAVTYRRGPIPTGRLPPAPRSQSRQPARQAATCRPLRSPPGAC